MDKSPDAFRTISEVSEFLETPAHVLRFWESRFPQIRPVKRAGGRRYYRPSDIALLTGIKRLLHDEGLTIRGVQKILREQGVRHVAGLTDEAIAADEAIDEAVIARYFGDADSAAPAQPEAPAQTVLSFPTAPQAAAAPASTIPAPAPRLIDDTRSFASRIRALPPGTLSSSRTQVATFARRLTTLRGQMADRADRGQG
ncbi:MerR family transcriptional regulator [Tabrizicola sp.]|uniref:MerR family transcriptional regulator n=1 Tax=Tabrizicola sp. TaxID=2005166 RepID=UPI00286B9416|nr:MerR family transcriptional regulator [Tabrizicola sp.]